MLVVSLCATNSDSATESSAFDPAARGSEHVWKMHEERRDIYSAPAIQDRQNKVAGKTKDINGFLKTARVSDRRATHDEKIKILTAVIAGEITQSGTGTPLSCYNETITSGSPLYGHYTVLRLTQELARSARTDTFTKSDNADKFKELERIGGISKDAFEEMLDYVHNTHRGFQNHNEEIIAEKTLFIIFHGLDGNGQFGEHVARQFSELAPLHLGSGPINRGEHFELYSPSAPNGRWFDPTFLLQMMHTLNAESREAFLNALTIDERGDINVSALGNVQVSAEIARINTRLNEITAETKAIIGTRLLSKVTIMGQSLGGITAWFVANKLAMHSDIRIGAIITDSAPFVWLKESKLLPYHIVVNTPIHDSLFHNWFDPCWIRLEKHAAHRGSMVAMNTVHQISLIFKRYKDTRQHGEMSDEFKKHAAQALVHNIHFPEKDV